MPEERLDAKDKKVLFVWILVALLGASVAYRYFFRAFPEAAVDFKVSRAAALEEARQFVVRQGEKVANYQSSIIFRVDDNAKTYLEREVGLEQANRLMASEVNVWYWHARFFRPLQKEEFRVRVDTAGRIVGYQHVQEEAAPGARLERGASLQLAESFLRDRLYVNLAGYDFLPEEANSIERPNRRDWSFTWERHAFRAPNREGGAPYRLRVTVTGGAVGGYEEFLKVPEAWERSYERLRSSNNLIETIAIIPYVFLYGAVLWVIIWLGRRGLIRWGGALKLGLLLALLFFIMTANQWPLDRASYDTNSSYSAFFVSQMAQAALTSLILGTMVALTIAAAEPLYRGDHPDWLRLGAAFTLPGIRTKEFFRACVIGLCLAAAHIGYVVIFYIVGGKLGVWAPQDINYTNVVSTSLPWVYPLTIGVYASASEEFLFRLFAIPFLLRATKSKFLAVVLPAFAWGFLHSNYPQEPAYTRGIEVGLIGIVAGLVMLRWGILATLVWHYTVDALLISLFLLRSGSLYFRASGAIVGAGALIPLIVAGAFYLVRRRFTADEHLLNRASPLVEAPATTPAAAAPLAATYEALDARKLWILLGCAVLGIAMLLSVKTETIGDFVRSSLDGRQAIARGDAAMRARQLDPASYRRVATFLNNFDGYTNEYLRREAGIAGANRIYQDLVPSAFWRVRYFRDSQTEEYAVVLRTDGALHSVRHTLEEKAPGANLGKEEALARAESYLREEKKLDLSKWKLVEAESKKQPARTDHKFTWEQTAPIVPAPAGGQAAHVRTELVVQGDEVSGYRVYLKLPEQWLLLQTRERLSAILHTVAVIGLLIALAIAVLVVFFKSLKHPDVAAVPWRRLAWWALWILAAMLVIFATNAPQFLERYPTQLPFKAYIGTVLISLLLAGGVVYSGAAFLFGLAWFFLRRRFGNERMPAWAGMPSAYYRDAFCVALLGAAGLAGLGRLSFLIARLWSTPHHALSADLPSGLDALSPAALVLAGALTWGLFLVGLLGLAAGLVVNYVRWRGVRFALAGLLAVMLVGDWGSPADFAKKALLQFIVVAVVWLGIARIARFNLLGYFLLSTTLSLSGAAAELFRQPNAYFRANGFAVAAIGLALLAWPLVAWRRLGGTAPLRPDGASPGA